MQGLGAGGLTEIALDLRSVSRCLGNSACDSAPMSSFRGVYAALSALTFYGSCALGLMVFYVAIRRLLNGRPSDGLVKLGYIGAVACFFAAGVTGYLFQPEAAGSHSTSAGMVSVMLTRTWAPALLLAGDAFAFVAFHLAAAESGHRLAPLDEPIASSAPRLMQAPRPQSVPGKLAVAAAGTPPTTGTTPGGVNGTGLRSVEQPSPTRSDNVSAIRPAARDRQATERPGVDEARPSPPAAATPTDSHPAPSMEELLLVGDGEDNPAIEDAIAQLRIEPLTGSFGIATPEHRSDPSVVETRETVASTQPPAAAASFVGLRGKLNFATVEATLSGSGIDARREDGVVKVVAWEDVVGVVARRLPPASPYDGETFVDVVSNAGSTLRILPWTQLTGDDLYSGSSNAIERARAFVQLVASRCPSAQVDSATRTFLGGRGLAAQLPTEDLLAQHDDRLS